MYTRHETAQLRHQFWTAFGQYMSPVPSFEGIKTNWINYKTNVRYISFKMNVDNNTAIVSIEFSHPDTETRLKSFDLFHSLKQEFISNSGSSWEWIRNDNVQSSVYTTLNNVSVYNKEDWPAIISFLKSRIMELDQFWTAHKFIFEMIQ